MHLSFLMVFISLTVFGYANIEDFGCESIPSPIDGQLYVTCNGNFAELRNFTESIKIFKLQDTILDVLPPDIFHLVTKPSVQKVIFDNVSMELLEVPELGDSPLKSIQDTVESFEIYNSSKVFAWDFSSLKFLKLKDFIVENSDLISITVPLVFWPELRFIQIQNCSVRWINPVAFKFNKKLTIFSLAHNEISHVSRLMFPKPAVNLYSIDLSFNNLFRLPEDMFSDMNALRELKLDNNRLKILDQNHLKGVWYNLKMLWLDGNKVLCKSLCWMTKRTDKPMFLESSTCVDLYKDVLIDEYFEDCAV